MMNSTGLAPAEMTNSSYSRASLSSNPVSSLTWTRMAISPLSGRSKNNRTSAACPAERGAGLQGVAYRIVVFRMSLLLILHGNAHGAIGHHGGDGVLVHHLVDGVLQDDDELIEGFNLTLEFNTADQVDGHRDFFFAQHVQERVL